MLGLLLWVDTLCIYQNDEDEKSEQVTKMGEIYSRATKVYAWLGEADRQTDCVFAVLQQFRDRKREGKVPTHFDAAEELSFRRQLFRDIYQAEAGTLPESSDMDLANIRLRKSRLVLINMIEQLVALDKDESRQLLEI
jgi:Heterokaryon incompatibility protein (HET)